MSSLKNLKTKRFLAKKLSSSIDNQLENILEEKKSMAKIWLVNAKEKNKNLEKLSFQEIITNLQKYWVNMDVSYFNLMI